MIKKLAGSWLILATRGLHLSQTSQLSLSVWLLPVRKHLPQLLVSAC